MIEWFKSHFLMPFAGVNYFWVWVLIAFLFLFAFAVTRVSRGGSALTAVERNLATRAIRPMSFLAWLVHAGIPWIIPLFCAWHFFNFSAEKVGVLRSRAYTNRAFWISSWKNTTSFGLAERTTVFDVGLVVDAALKKLASQGAGGWSAPSAGAGHRRAISLAVLDALEDPDGIEREWPNVSERQETTLPLWVVESVERMTLDAIRQSENISRIILQYEARQVSGLETWGSKEALSAELKTSRHKVTSMKEPLLIPVPPLPQLRLIHAEADRDKPDVLLVSFLAQENGGTTPSPQTVYFLVEGEPNARELSIDFRPGQVVVKPEKVTGQPNVIEQRFSAEGFGLGPVPVTRPGSRPQMLKLPVGAAGQALAQRWAARLGTNKLDWTADWMATLPGTYGIQLKAILDACGTVTPGPTALPANQVVVLHAAPGANHGSRTLHGNLVPISRSAGASLSNQGLVFSAHPVDPEIRAGLLRNPAYPPRPYLTAGGSQMALPFPPPAVEGIDRDLTAATLTSLYLAQKRAANAPAAPPAAGATALGYGRMDELIRETARGRKAATHLCWILFLVALYAGKCLLAILSAKRH